MYDFEEYKKILEGFAKKYIDLVEKKEDKTLISFKLSHTYRVTENMKRIAISCNLNEHDVFLAKIIGLFHDIGRFKQYYEYRTYDDKKSVNHAIYSANFLKDNNILEKLNEEDFNIVYKSVYYHNVYLICNIEEEISNKELFFLKMIRDADRLDIYEAMANRVPKMEKQEQFIWYNERDFSGNISDVVYKQVIDCDLVNMRDCKSISESIMARFSWIFNEISFKECLNIIIEEKYFEKIYDYMTKTQRATEIYNFIMNYIQKRIKDNSSFVYNY